MTPQSDRHPVDPGSTEPSTPVEPVAGPESLLSILGGPRSAIEATIPPVVFVIAWMLTHHNVVAGGLWAVGSGIVIGGIALAQKKRATSVIFGLLAVIGSAMVAAYTGKAVDFFLLRLLANAASMLTWAASIAVRWPFLGVALGIVLGTKTRWRRDPALVRAYNNASWFWVAQYGVRVAVLTYFWATDHVLALSVAHILLSYPLFAASLVGSGWALFSSIPKGHPGIRHPQTPDQAEPTKSAESTESAANDAHMD